MADAAPPRSRVERHIMQLLDSDLASVRPKPDSARAKASVPLGSTTTPQQLAVDEANRVIALLQQHRMPNAGTQQQQQHRPSPPRQRTPPQESAAILQTKTFDHHVRYMAAACQAPPPKAFFFLEQALEAGSRLAGTELGMCYLNGWGTTRNVGKGLQLLDDASQDAHPGAMLAVGLCMCDGVGVPEDGRCAVVWMERAAALNYAPAHHLLGEMYEVGEEGAVERDVVKAYTHYRAAATAGFPDSQLNLAKLYMLGSQLGVEPCINDAETKAMYWLQRAAASGSLEAQTLLQRHGATHDDPEKHGARAAALAASGEAPQPTPAGQAE